MLIRTNGGIIILLYLSFPKETSKKLKCGRNYPDFNYRNYEAAICYDKAQRYVEALDHLIIAHNAGDLRVLQKARIPELIWSDSIIHKKEFTAITCQPYNGIDYIEVQASKPSLRDSLIKLWMWQLGPSSVEYFSYLNCIDCRKDYPDHLKPMERFALMERKLDTLISTYGFPTAEAVGEKYAQISAYSILIHSADLNLMEKYNDDVLKPQLFMTRSVLRKRCHKNTVLSMNRINVDFIPFLTRAIWSREDLRMVLNPCLSMSNCSVLVRIQSPIAINLGHIKIISSRSASLLRRHQGKQKHQNQKPCPKA